jgi:hypothetical protein
MTENAGGDLVDVDPGRQHQVMEEKRWQTIATERPFYLPGHSR